MATGGILDRIGRTARQAFAVALLAAFVPDAAAEPATRVCRQLEAQFAALGAGDIVFWRQMRAGELADLVPQAGLAPSHQILELLVSADGVPVLIADSAEAIVDWIEGHEVRLATLH